MSLHAHVYEYGAAAAVNTSGAKKAGCATCAAGHSPASSKTALASLDPGILAQPARIVRREDEDHAAVRDQRQQSIRSLLLHRRAALAAACFLAGHVRRAVRDDAAGARGAVELAGFAAHAQAD